MRIIFASVIAAFAIFQTYSPTSSFVSTWQDMPIGDGGQKTGFDYHLSTDLLLVRNDTWGGHYHKTTGTCSNGLIKTYSAPCWEQVVTATSMPSSDVTLDNGASGNVGTTELIACDANQNVFYMLWNTYLYVSIDKGAHWVKSGSGGGLRTSQNANSGPKDRSKFIWCDPNDTNGDIVYVATLSGVTGSTTGVFKSSNGTAGASATFTQVTGIGTPTSGFPQLIASDPASSVIGGVTQHFYIWTQGSGLYETTNGGSSFSLTSGSPTSQVMVKLRVDKFSQVWLLDGTATMRVRSAAGVWGTKTYGGTNGAFNIAFDHTSSTVGSQRIFASWNDGNIQVSNDNGGTWTGGALNNTFAAPTGQAPWLATANQCNTPCAFGTYFNVLDYIFDTNLKLWAAGGIAPWWTANLTGSSTTQWSADAIGIEQLVVNQIIAPFGSSPTMATWDRGVILIKVPGDQSSVTVQVPNITTISQIQAAWSVDYSGSAPYYMAALISSNAGSGDYYSYTSDGGHTYTKFPSYPSGVGSGGAIAVSTTTNTLIYPYISGLGVGLQYTTNGGLTSWAKSSITGCSDDFVSSFYNNRQPLASDRITANKFYVIDQAQNICVSTDGGATFTLARAGPIEGFVYRDKIKTVPGQAGHFFYTLGPQNTPAGNIHLWKTTNGGGNLATIGTNLRDVWYIGFGAAQPGGSGYPTIYAEAFLNGVQCLCKSVDGGTTWTALNIPSSEFPWPLNKFDFIQDVSGDMNFYGRFMVSWIGSGAAFYDTPDACPAVYFTNVKPTQSLSGTSVTITAKHSGVIPVSGVNFYVNGVQFGGTQTGQDTYSVNLNATANAGAATLKVEAVGNGCPQGGTGNFMSLPVTLS